jgi:hypothetical protein
MIKMDTASCISAWSIQNCVGAFNSAARKREESTMQLPNVNPAGGQGQRKPRACVVTFRLSGKCQRCGQPLNPAYIGIAGIHGRCGPSRSAKGVTAVTSTTALDEILNLLWAGNPTEENFEFFCSNCQHLFANCPHDKSPTASATIRAAVHSQKSGGDLHERQNAERIWAAGGT